MIKIGLTGNIACGKSLVEKFLETKGFPIIDADKIVHSLFENEKVKEQICLMFKDYNILNPDKSINRQKMGEIIFNNEALKQRLEELIHPIVKNKINTFFKQNSDEFDKKLVFCSVPLLFEAHFEDLFDKIILVYSNKEVQLERLMKRNNFSKEEALLRINVQDSMEEKKKLSNFVVDNSFEISETEKQIEKIIEQLENNI